jgi:hypothetical protein
MKKLVRYFFLSAILFSPLPLFAIEWTGGSFDAEYGIETYYERVNGNRDLTSLDINLRTGDNWHYKEYLKFALEQRLPGNTTLKIYFDGYHTSDKTVWSSGRTANRRLQLNESYLSLSNRYLTLKIGDNTDLFTNYTFNRAYKGVSLKVSPVYFLDLYAIGGKEIVDNNYERAFGGGRIVFRPRPDLLFGATFIHSESAWLNDSTTDTDFVNDVLSLDATVNCFRPLGNPLSLKAEGSVSWYNNDRQDPTSSLVQGWALDLRAVYKFRNGLQTDVQYIYVDPLFSSKLATIANDRETITGKVQYYKDSESASFSFYLENTFYHDHLTDDSTVAYRTNSNDLHAAFAIRPFTQYRFSHFRNAKFLVDLEYSTNWSEDHPRSVDNNTYLATVAFENTFRKLNYGFEHDFEYANDATTGGVDSISNIISATVGYGFYIYTIEFIPSLSNGIIFTNLYYQNPNSTRFQIDATVKAGISITNKPTNTTLTVSYGGNFVDPAEGANTRKNATEITFKQEFNKLRIDRERLPLIVIFSYKKNDYWSKDHTRSWGEDVWKLNLSVTF